MKVTKAVIPAAGLGTRVLPATKSVPKEMLPIVDRPAIHYIVEEAVRAGITDILIITSRGKSSVEDYFDRAPELEDRLLASGKEDLYRQIIDVTQMANISTSASRRPRGWAMRCFAPKALWAAIPLPSSTGMTSSSPRRTSPPSASSVKPTTGTAWG